MPYLVESEYLKVNTQRMIMPKGEPTGYGNLFFLFSRNIEQSIKTINSEAVDNINRYYFYYFNRFYRGTIFNRVYKEDMYEKQNKIYDNIKAEVKINPHPNKPLNKTGNRNAYFELMEYLDIFHKLSENQSATKKIPALCKYLEMIINREDLSGYNKYLLVDIDQFGTLDTNLNMITECFPYFIYYIIYRYPELAKTLDIDIIFYVEPSFTLKINPSMCKDKDYILFKNELTKLFAHSKKSSIESVDDVALEKNVQKEIITNTIMKKYNFVGDENDNIKETIEDKVSSAMDEIGELVDDVVDDEIIENRAIDNINDDEDTIKKLYQYNNANKKAKSAASSARDKLLRKEQEELRINDVKLSDINKKTGVNTKIKTKNVSNAILTTNDNMKEVKFANFEKNYNEELMQKDIMNNFLALNNKSIPMYVRKVEVEDSSDELNYKETYKIYLEDENRQRHVITIDIPKFIEDKFMYLGGNKKIIIKQNFMYPVVKHANDTVQIVTNVNKMFITRIGTRSLASIEKMKKLIQTNPDVLNMFKFGNASIINTKYISTIEYDELSKTVVEFDNKKCHIIFNQKNALEYAEKNNIKVPEKHIFIGTMNKEPIFINISTQRTSDNKSICELIIESMNEDIQNEYMRIKSGKRLMYSSAKTMAQAIPLITLLSTWEGLTTVLKKMKVKYRLSENLPKDLKMNEAYIKFKDCYLIYEDTVEASLLLNGIHVIPCGEYSIGDMDTNEPYIEYFNKVYGKRSIIYALFNQYEFMIDEITREILEDINLPTDFVELCIYANNLLADNAYTKENNQNIYRVRSNEVIPAILSSLIANNYTTFRNSGGKKKLSIPRDAVIKELLKLQTVEDYSTLNPEPYGAL